MASKLPLCSGRFSVYDTSAAQIQEWFQQGELTSVDVVTAYLDQIEKHNIKGLGLHAVIEIAPRQLVLKQAKTLDDERTSQGSRGPMHGIPVLIKVCIISTEMCCAEHQQDIFNTDPVLGMGTTCGSAALRGAKPKRNAAIVDAVRVSRYQSSLANISYYKIPIACSSWCYRDWESEPVGKRARRCKSSLPLTWS